jgi:vacuolar-type H+-ATPase subunit H
MRIAAGILTIIGGFIGGTLWTTILHELGVYGVLIYVPGILAVIGGVMALRRVHWGWALAGAICSLTFPFTGIPAIILLVKSKGDFLPREIAIQGDERHKCLTYYQEEKKLRLLYERVEQIFEKKLRKYEDAYFKARKARRDFWPSMEKIFEAREYMSHAATEIVKRKKAMKPAPSAASAMSSAWLAAYLDYEALRDPSNIVASSNPVEVAIRQKRAKELYTNYKKSMHKAWKEEREFRKRLNLSSGEYQRIVDYAEIAVAADEWLQKLEKECP